MSNKKAKRQTITLFDNYNGYDFNEFKKDLIESNNLENIGDEVVWDCIYDQMDEDFSNCKHELENMFGDSRVIVCGTAGRWNGDFECAKIFENILDAVVNCIEGCDYIKVMQLQNGLIEIKSTHHDGTNCFYIRRLTDRGLRLYDNWNFGYRTRFAHLLRFEILKKIWESRTYSSLPKRAW